jgi:hypothetical protein
MPKLTTPKGMSINRLSLFFGHPTLLAKRAPTFYQYILLSLVIKVQEKDSSLSQTCEYSPALGISMSITYLDKANISDCI